MTLVVGVLAMMAVITHVVQVPQLSYATVYKIGESTGQSPAIKPLPISDIICEFCCFLIFRD